MRAHKAVLRQHNSSQQDSVKAGQQFKVRQWLSSAAGHSKTVIRQHGSSQNGSGKAVSKSQKGGGKAEQQFTEWQGSQQVTIRRW